MKNRRHERAKFQKRVQKPGEPFEHFFRDVSSLVKTCDYTDVDDMLLNKIIQGLRDQDLSKRIELTSGLTLQKSIKMVKQTGQVEMERRERSLDDKQTEEIKQVRHGSGHYRGKVPNRS